MEQSLDFLRQSAKAGMRPQGPKQVGARSGSPWRGADDPNNEQGVPIPGWQVALLLSIPWHVDPSGRSPFNSAPFATKLHRLDQLLDTDAASTDPKTLVEAVAKEPFSAREFDRYLEAMPAELRRDEHRLYRLLAHDAAGTAERRLRDLSQDLDTRSDHDFTVWMMLRDRHDDPITRSELAAFRSRASEVHRPGELQIRATARVFAKAGEFSEASQYYRWLAAELVEHQEFLLKSLAHVYDTKDVPSQSARFSRNGVDSRGPTERWHAVKASELVRSRARAGRVDEAIGLLRGFVTAAADQPNPTAGGSSLSSFELHRATTTLSLIYGFPRLDDFDGPPDRVRFADLILYRERLFPSTADNRWPGDVAWMTRAASAFVDWLDDLTVDATSTVEAALTVAWQLHLAAKPMLPRRYWRTSLPASPPKKASRVCTTWPGWACAWALRCPPKSPKKHSPKGS